MQLAQINKGDEVSIKHSESELIVSTFHSNIDKVRNILNKYKDLDLQKELTILRKENADWS